MDRPLLSPRRILLALRTWVWWLGDRGVGFPFWYFLRFEYRNDAYERWKAAGHKRPPTFYFKSPWE